jgi:HK97 family phage major capsid protein
LIYSLFDLFLNEKGITKEELNKKGAEELASLYNDYNEKSSADLSAAIEAKASKEDIEALKSEIVKTNIEHTKTLNEALKEYGVAIKKLSKREKEDAAKQTSSLYEGLKAGKETLSSIKDGNDGRLKFKAAGTMLISTNISGGNVPVEQRLSGLDDIPSREVRLLSIVSRGTASSNVISWVSKVNRDGAAAGTAEGATKNQIDFDLVVNSESVIKFSAFIKISTEMVGDIDFMNTEINNELMGEMLRLIETQVYSGSGAGTNLNGILTQATAFVAATAPVAVVNANLVDVLRTAATQIQIANQSAPTYILLHPTDVLGLKQIKRSTTDKAYIDALQLVAGSLSLDGIPIIETTLVTADTYLIGDFKKATVFDKGSIDIEVGRSGTDFVDNLVTVLAEWRGLNVIKTNQTTAFVTGTISTDVAALIALV